MPMRETVHPGEGRLERLEAAGQEHLLTALDRLDPPARARLEAEIDALDLDLVSRLVQTLVFGDGASAVSKLELKDKSGGYVTVWSGINEDPEERRGPRTWFVRKFDKTAQEIVGVKITIANTVARGYKTIDAIQLVGE